MSETPIRPDDPELASRLADRWEGASPAIHLAARAWRDHGIMPGPSPWTVKVEPPDEDGDTFTKLVLDGWCVFGGHIFANDHDDPLAASLDLKRRLEAPIGGAPLPEGVEAVYRAAGQRINELGWEWRNGGDWSWVSGPVPDYRLTDAFDCRPPQPQPVTITVDAADTADDVLAKVAAARGGAK